MKKILYCVKLTKQSDAQAHQRKDGYLAQNGVVIGYTLGEARKKARRFNGEVERVFEDPEPEPQKHTLGMLYVASTGNHQGLIVEEGTGANITIVYDKEHAPFIVTACNSHAELLEALKAALDSMVNQKPLGTRERVLKQVRAVIAKAENA